MARKIYLLGLRHNEFPFVESEREALDLSSNKQMLVIDFARDSEEKIREKKEADIKRFKGFGARKIEFTSDLNDKEIKKRLIQIDLLYIAGGDTKLLISKLKEKGLDDLIKSFNGIIIGNSAGAYVCCKGFVEKTEKKVLSGLRIVDIIMKAHYTPEFDSMLSELSKNKEIYAISDGSVIVIEAEKLSFVGDIYKFVKGKKEKVN